MVNGKSKFNSFGQNLLFISLVVLLNACGGSNSDLPIDNNQPNPPINTNLEVDVGPDRTIVQTDVLDLAPTVTENGQFPQGSVSYTWRQLAGPGIANFTNVNYKDTTVTFTQVGSYKLNLMVELNIKPVPKNYQKH